MRANYVEYEKLMDRLYYGVALTDNQLNYAAEEIRQYIVNNGAADVLEKLGIGIQIKTKSAVLLPEEMVSERLIWISGERTGKLLELNEIRNIGMFLRGGAFYKSEVVAG